MPDKKDELVAGIHRYDLFSPSTIFQGFNASEEAKAHFFERFNKYMTFATRGLCETNPQFKQVIPYCLILRGKEIYVTRRLDKGGEARLHNKHSVGIGGHMNPVQGVDGEGVIKCNLFRELHEELQFLWPGRVCAPPPEFVGLINDDSNDVSAVHLAAVYVFKLPLGTRIKVRETEELAGGFMKLKEAAELPNLEPWSALCFTQYLLPHLEKEPA